MTGSNQFSEKIAREAAAVISQEIDTHGQSAAVISQEINAQTQTEQDTALIFLQELRRKKEKELRLLDKIEKNICREETENIHQHLKAFLSCNEDSFLTGKEAACLRPIYEDRAKPPARHQLRGAPINFPATITKLEVGHYKFTLPPLFSKRTHEKTFRDGKAIQYLVAYLLQEYENRNGIIRKMKRPMVIFIHHVKDWSGKKWVPDADNLDAKSIVDALQGYFYANDSVLDITLIHTGKLDEKSFTELHLIDAV